MLGQPCDGLASHPMGERNTPISSFMIQKRDELRPDTPLGSYADFTIRLGFIASGYVASPF